MMVSSATSMTAHCRGDRLRASPAMWSCKHGRVQVGEQSGKNHAGSKFTVLGLKKIIIISMKKKKKCDTFSLESWPSSLAADRIWAP